MLSLAAHVVFFQLSGLIFVFPEPSPSQPISVSVVNTGPPDNEDLASGRVEETPEPLKEEKSDDASILSRFDSKGSSPEKGGKYQARKTIIPREKMPPPEPARRKDKEYVVAKKPETPKTRVASLGRPDRETKRRVVTKKFDPFSAETMKKADKAERAERFERDDVASPARHVRPSEETTDMANPSPKQKIRLSGMTGVRGGDMGEYAASSTGDVIDLGDEAVVSLNTRSFVYMDYFSSIKEAIELFWAYPEDAVAQGLSGKTMIRFSLDSSGDLEEVRLIKSSGSKILDDEAQLAVKVAAPYEAFPPSLDKKRIHIIATFVYQPSFSSVR